MQMYSNTPSDFDFKLSRSIASGPLFPCPRHKSASATAGLAPEFCQFMP